ncbi:MAG: BatD family protein [Prevotellaceae bacterium]|nr:BatD family protein [Prevotellaceae bacterium]
MSYNYICDLRGRILLGALMVVLCVSLCDAANLQAQAPGRVAVGEQFRLTYTIGTHDVSDIRLGDIPDGLEVLIGPRTSTSSSFQMVNGKTSSNESTTFTYILMANKAGRFVIPAAKAVSGGRGISSNSVTITVSGGSSAGAGGSGSSSSTGSSGSRSLSDGRTRVTGNDLFITVSASKNRVCEQEPVLLTYKVYTQVDLSALEGKMPDLKGFHTQEVTLPQQKSFSVETYKGKTYHTVVWSQYLMYPQVTGDLVIPSITFHGTVVMQDTNLDSFEAFLNGGGYTEVNKNINAPSVNIHVDPLPEKPKNFSGGVGRFDIALAVDNDNDRVVAKSGEPIKLRVSVSGNGNLKLIKQPKLNLPKDFDVYDPKVEDNTRLTSNGLEGSMTYEYLCVPRHKGKYTLPAIEFTYFDTGTRKYETKRTQTYDIDVLQGEAGSEYSEQEALKLLNSDIRHIKTGDSTMTKRGDYFFLGTWFWVLLLLSFIAFVALVIIFRQRAIDNANVAKMRGKKANKVATKRLRFAGKLLKEGKNNEFYDEVLKALWGYVGDKLNMPVEQLSKDNIKENLLNCGFAESDALAFVNVIEECEFARYAPAAQAEGTVTEMQKVYESAAEMIEKMEDGFKSRKKNRTKIGAIAFAIAMVSVVPANAVTKAEGDSAYVHEEYSEAINIYESLLKKGESADVYFNLGNAYYRDKNFTRAIINYERALLLDPGDADIRFNLDMARTRTIDKIVPQGEMFFITWFRAVVNVMSVDAWAAIAIIAFVLFLAAVLFYLLSNQTRLRKIGFYTSLVMLLTFALSMVAAFQQKHQMEVRESVIVTSPSVSVKSTPAENGTDLFVIHEGTKARIIDDTMKDWKEVKLDDGKRGWLQLSQVERI